MNTDSPIINNDSIDPDDSSNNDDELEQNNQDNITSKNGHSPAAMIAKRETQFVLLLRIGLFTLLVSAAAVVVVDVAALFPHHSERLPVELYPWSLHTLW